MSLSRTTILLLILIELLSFCAWIFPVFNTFCFFIILALVLLLSLKNLSHGLLIASSELIIGSYGYLFSLNISQGANIISLRLGIFIVIMLAWAINTVRGDGFQSYWSRLKNFHFFRYYLLLAIALVWGFVFALIRGNDFGNIFLDFNNWLFFLYLLPLIAVGHEEKFWSSLKIVALACLLWLIIKTLLLFYIFSHQFIWALPEVYRWVRDTRVGEITQFKGSFYRIFLQSQIYCLLAFFIFLPTIKKTLSRRYLIFLVGCLSVVLTSFSRSFWAGFVLGLITAGGLLVYKLWITAHGSKESFKRFFIYVLHFLTVCFLAFILIFAVAYAPPKAKTNLMASLGQRATEIEAAGSSRLSMLKPLLISIVNHPIIGSGFGTTVTYESLDPRIIPATAGGSGEFTTYAFEWGYLDLLLKIGLFGVFIYLLLIYKLLQTLWQQVKSAISNQQSAISNLSLGLSLAIIALLAVNIFTPYLNHPLGIGFVLVVSVWLSYNQTNQASQAN